MTKNWLIELLDRRIGLLDTITNLEEKEDIRKDITLLLEIYKTLFSIEEGMNLANNIGKLFVDKGDGGYRN